MKYHRYLFDAPTGTTKSWNVIKKQLQGDLAFGMNGWEMTKMGDVLCGRCHVTGRCCRNATWSGKRIQFMLTMTKTILTYIFRNVAPAHSKSSKWTLLCRLLQCCYPFWNGLNCMVRFFYSISIWMSDIWRWEGCTPSQSMGMFFCFLFFVFFLGGGGGEGGGALFWCELSLFCFLYYYHYKHLGIQNRRISGSAITHLTFSASGPSFTILDWTGYHWTLIKSLNSYSGLNYSTRVFATLQLTKK